jgi:sorbitol-specific phosphotransferase system component IIC
MACFAASWVIARYKIPIYPFACGFKQRYGLPCPTCGMTTSVLAFAQGRLIDSFNVQPAAFFFCLLALATAFFAFLIACFGLYSPRLERRIVTLKIRYLIVALALVLIAGWVFTFARALMLKQQ